MMGATGTVVLESLSADFPSGVPSHSCANPIQHVPNPAAQAANITFSAAKAQSSTIHGARGCRDHDQRGGMIEDIEFWIFENALEMTRCQRRRRGFQHMGFCLARNARK